MSVCNLVWLDWTWGDCWTTECYSSFIFDTACISCANKSDPVLSLSMVHLNRLFKSVWQECLLNRLQHLFQIDLASGISSKILPVLGNDSCSIISKCIISIPQLHRIQNFWVTLHNEPYICIFLRQENRTDCHANLWTVSRSTVDKPFWFWE